MDVIFALVCAIAVVVALFSCVWIVVESYALWLHAQPLAKRPVMTDVVPGALRADIVAAGLCEPDGIVTADAGRVRMLATALDKLILKCHPVADVAVLADRFARNQTSPDVVLAMLQGADVDASGYGYGILSSALVREAAARRMQPNHPMYVRAVAR